MVHKSATANRGASQTAKELLPLVYEELRRLASDKFFPERPGQTLPPTALAHDWRSVAGVSYFLERSANPAAPFTLLATNILGQAGTTSYGDTNAAGKGPFFYRVGIRSP